MVLVYYDKSGDDGYPQYSSPIFVLTAIYIRAEVWKTSFSQIQDFRKTLLEKHGLPVKTEMHLKYFLLNKKDYTPSHHNIKGYIERK